MRVDGQAGILVELFEDLEQQAQGLSLRERDEEVDALGAAEYISVDLAARLHASVGREMVLRLGDGLTLRARVDRVGADFCLLHDDHASWLVPPASALTVEGLSPRALAEAARPVVARLTLAAMLRRLARERADCVLHLRGADRLEGRVGRVGRDFFELDGPGPAVPFGALTALRVRS